MVRSLERKKQIPPAVLGGHKNPFVLLGFSFLTTEKVLRGLILARKIRNLEKMLKIWKRRNLTLHGRINIVKTLGLSKLIYSASVLAVPEHFIEKINKLTFNFIWAGKPPNIIRNTIVGEQEDGGLKMCDFKIMEKCSKLHGLKDFKTILKPFGK